MTNEEFVRRITALVDEYMADVAARLSMALNGDATPRTVRARRSPRPLSDKYRRIVEMYLEGKALKDIASECGGSANDIGSIVARLRQKGHDIPRRYVPANGVES